METTRRVLAVLATGGEWCAWDITRVAEVRKGSIYTTLQRLEARGFATSRKDEHWTGRGVAPRWFLITEKGLRYWRAIEEIAQLD